MGCCVSRKEDPSLLTGSASEFSQNARVIFVGPKGVGKASLVYRIVEGTPLEDRAKIQYENKGDGWEETEIWKSVVEVSEIKAVVRVSLRAATRHDDESIRGQSFRNPYRGMDGVILVFDVTSRESFDAVKTILLEAEIFSEDSRKTFLLLGNKQDVPDKRQVPTEEAKQWAQSKKMLFLEVSATQGTEVTTAMNTLCKAILEAKTESSNPSAKSQQNLHKYTKTSICETLGIPIA